MSKSLVLVGSCLMVGWLTACGPSGFSSADNEKNDVQERLAMDQIRFNNALAEAGIQDTSGTGSSASGLPTSGSPDPTGTGTSTGTCQLASTSGSSGRDRKSVV